MTERMIERIIENWLNNANERGYQIPFCQCLISKDHTILYVSSHGPMEQGKDIISIDKTGQIYAFQLKGGDIDLAEWRKIQGELEDLITIPLKHPNIEKSSPYKAFLVTNGNISDPVRVNIDDKNIGYKQRGYPELKVISKEQLLSSFIEIHGSFLPDQPSDFRAFLELFLNKGDGPLDIDIFCKFYEDFLFIEYKSENDIKRKIASSILLAQYALNSFERNNNHVPLIEGWTILCGYILALAEKHKMDRNDWMQSYNLIIERINEQLESLKNEFISRKDYLEGSYFGDGGLLYKARITIVLGWLSAFELYKIKTQKDNKIDDVVYNSIKKYYLDNTWYWGESATPYFLMMSELARFFSDFKLSNDIIINLIRQIIISNGQYGNGFPDPYITLNQIIKYYYKIPTEDQLNMNTYLLSSYHLEALIDVLARRECKEPLEPLWDKILDINKCTFVPEPTWKFFFKKSETGEQIQNFYKMPQSWKELCIEANKNNLAIPTILTTYYPFLNYFLLCFPHRLNHNSNLYLDINYCK